MRRGPPAVLIVLDKTWRYPTMASSFQISVTRLLFSVAVRTEF